MKMQNKIMLTIFKPKGIDWLGFRVTKNNYYTYHHIFKKVYGEYSNLYPLYPIHNGAILSLYSHAYIHTLEQLNPELYREFNNAFKELALTMLPPTDEYFANISRLLEKDKIYYKRYKGMIR